jgi:predicted alpha/beta superfamily hydrolase
MKQKGALLVMVTLALLISNMGCTGQTSKKYTIGQNIQLKSKILNEERKIFIHLPNNYEKTKQKYPVLYILDGEWNFNFAQGIVSFLSARNRIPGMIVVGIANTNRARDFYNLSSKPGDKNNDFLEFLEDELLPYIDSNYRTQPYRVLFGHSATATATILMLFSKPKSFNGYIAVSPYLLSWRGGLNLTEFAQKRLKEYSSLNKSLFISVGAEPVHKGSYDQFFNLLKTTRPQGFRWGFLHFPSDDHASVPLKSLYSGLEYLYSQWIPPLELAEKGAESIIEHYDHLSKRFGYPVSFNENIMNRFIYDLFQTDNYRHGITLIKQLQEKYGYKSKIPEWTFHVLGYRLFHENQLEQAIEIFKLNIKEYPESPEVYYGLGEAYEKTGQPELAEKNYQITYNKAKETNHRNLQFYESSLKRIQKKLSEKRHDDLK